MPFVSVVHDLTPITHPEWHAGRTLIGFVPMWERTVERAARFLCVSKTTADDLVARYPETAPRVRVARNGVDRDVLQPRRRPRRPGSARASGIRTRGPTSCTWARSSPARTSRGSWPPASGCGAGAAPARTSCSPAAPGWKTAGLHRRIVRSPYRDKIHVAGYTARDAARELYRAAEVFVYPSLAEGFGLPLLEAMACGTPVVSSTADALVEVAGDAALYAPARDIEALSRQIERALEDDDARAALRAAGHARAALFRWEDAARDTAAAVAEAARETA